MSKTYQSKEIIEYLDTRFSEKENLWNEGYSLNGLQVECPKLIKKIVFAVDASLELFEKANDADLIIVHHGIIWKNTPKERIIKNEYKKLKTLIQNDTGLYAVHLPLDFDEEIGNNVGIAKTLDLIEIEKLGLVSKTAKTKKPMSFEEFSEIVKNKINPNSKFIKFTDKVNKIGISSGGGKHDLNNAIKEGCDTFITGDSAHSIYHTAKENDINLIFSGHYSTETFGVMALMNLIKDKFDIEVEFIDINTGL